LPGLSLFTAALRARRNRGHESAEYAVLVADPWQGRRLSDAPTDLCLAVAGDWGIRRVYAETEPDNRRMITLLKHHGFEVERRPEEGLVVASVGPAVGTQGP
jgi:acetyltransferase